MHSTSASSHLPSLDQKMRSDIRAEQVRMFVLNTPSVCVLATLFAALLSLYLSNQVNSAMVYLWLGIKVLAVIPRIFHARLIEGDDSMHQTRSQNWALALVFLDGLWWGMAGPMLLPGLDTQASTILGCALMGIVAVATFTLHVYPQAMVLYCVPILLPSAIFFIWQGHSFGLFMGLSQALFLVGIMSVARRAHSHATEMLWRRFSMDRILVEKEQALQEAARQDSIKSQFVATMSHELRTPLHGILGLTKMLQDKHTDTSTLHQLGLVERAGEHLLMLINRVLDFSRIEAGYLTLDHKPFDLRAMLGDTLSLTAITAQDKGLQMTWLLDMPTPTWVEGDASKFKQVLLNLIGNAIKFTNTGTVHVVANYTAETDQATVRVHDSGVGIPLKDLPSIFEPYKQAHGVAGGPTGGTGLGLTISREISRAMGGDITCESKEGVGSVFTFTAILSHIEESRSQAQSHATHLPVQAPKRTHGSDTSIRLNGHVLLAEDNEVNAMIVNLQLQRKGLTVEHVQNGQEALERLLRTDQRRPDVVLMDCQMPLLDGFETTVQLRKHERTQGLARLPVIALTASAMAEDSARCLDAGMDAHLSKPFNEEQLIDLLASFLMPKQPVFQ